MLTAKEIDDHKKLILHRMINRFRLDDDLTVHVYVKDLDTRMELSSWFSNESYIKNNKLRFFSDRPKAGGYAHADVGILYKSHEMEYANEWRMDGMITLEIL